MFISNITERGATPALINTLAFSEARLKMIAENVANATTPGYRAKQLDPRAFQAAMREALDARGGDPNRAFVIKDNGQVRTGKYGLLQVTPTERPVDNILFHDGTNLSIEREMADLAETGMTHELMATLLRGSFDGLRKAIRGVVG
jgi:flagellar basal-body rod protein FlgB